MSQNELLLFFTNQSQVLILKGTIDYVCETSKTYIQRMKTTDDQFSCLSKGHVNNFAIHANNCGPLKTASTTSPLYGSSEASHTGGVKRSRLDRSSKPITGYWDQLPPGGGPRQQAIFPSVDLLWKGCYWFRQLCFVFSFCLIVLDFERKIE